MRALQVGAVSFAFHRSLVVILRIFSVAPQYSPQWFSRAEIGTTAMIFKADQRTAIPTDCHVSNTPGHVRPFVNGPRVEYPEPSHVRPISWPVVMLQQLVAAAHRQHRHIIFNRSPQADTLYLVQILRDRGLLFILPAANKQHIIFIRCQGVTNAQADNSQLYTTELTTSAQRYYIAPVSVQV